MRYILLKINVMMLLGLTLTPLQSQTTLNVKPTGGGAPTTYTLSGIRKLTFPSVGNFTINKTIGGADNYSLTSVQHLKFSSLTTEKANIFDAKSEFQLFPNPVNDVLNIRLSLDENLVGATQNDVRPVSTVEILSIDGKILYRTNLTDFGTNHQINVSQFEQGIYLCRLNNGNRIQTIKFFKK